MDLSYSQKRLWFINELEGLSSLYSLPNYMEIEGDLHVSSLEKSLNQIIEHQSILRSNFFQGKVYHIRKLTLIRSLFWILVTFLYMEKRTERKKQ